MHTSSNPPHYGRNHPFTPAHTPPPHTLSTHPLHTHPPPSSPPHIPLPHKYSWGDLCLSGCRLSACAALFCSSSRQRQLHPGLSTDPYGYAQPLQLFAEMVFTQWHASTLPPHPPPIPPPLLLLSLLTLPLSLSPSPSPSSPSSSPPFPDNLALELPLVALLWRLQDINQDKLQKHGGN